MIGFCKTNDFFIANPSFTNINGDYTRGPRQMEHTEIKLTTSVERDDGKAQYHQSEQGQGPTVE